MPNLYETFYGIGLKYYLVKAKDGVMHVQASTHRDRLENPVIEVGSKIATSIAFRIQPGKKLYIQRINSKQKGMGTKMVDAVVNHFPDYAYSVVDGSLRKGDNGPTFWDKMKVKHPSLQVIKPINQARVNAFSMGLKLSAITHKKVLPRIR